MLKTERTEAWEREDTPDPLGMPLQGMVTMEAISRTSRYADKGRAQDVAFNPVGQVVGQMNEIKSCRELIYVRVEGYVEATDRLAALQSVLDKASVREPREWVVHCNLREQRAAFQGEVDRPAFYEREQ